MNPRDELSAYQAAMGAESLRRQYLADGRDEAGSCPACGAVAHQGHRRDCERKPSPIAAAS